MNERLEEIRVMMKLNKKEFADKLNITQQAYTNYIQGKRDIPTNVLILIKQLFNVSIDWLLIGSGHIFDKNTDNISYIDEIVKDLEKLSEKKQEIFYHKIRTIILEQEESSCQ